MSERNVSPPNFPFPINTKLAVIGLIVVLILAGIGTSLFIVNPTEEAVVTRFGRFQRQVGPGLQVKLPFFIERNHNVPTQVVQNMSFGFRTEEAGVQTRYSNQDYSHESIMLTGDLNIVDVEWIIQYRIDDPYNWLFNVEDPYQTLKDISQSVMNQLIGDRAILNVISTSRREIEYEAAVMMNEIFNNYELGVRVTSVRLQNTVPPQGRVQDAFEDVNRAVQDLERIINEGRREFNREIPRARGEADRMLEEAEGYAARRVNTARGDVARYNAVLREYEQQPRITRIRLYNELIEDLFGEDSQLNLIDSNFENLVPLLNLNSQTPARSGGQE